MIRNAVRNVDVVLFPVQSDWWVHGQPRGGTEGCAGRSAKSTAKLANVRQCVADLLMTLRKVMIVAPAYEVGDARIRMMFRLK